MIKQRIVRSIAALTLLAAGFSAQAELVAVAEAAKQPLGTTVEVQGQLVAQHGLNFFGFSDGTAEIEVHVTEVAWDQVDLVGPEDKLILEGPLMSESEHPLYLEVVKMQVQQ